MYVDLFENSNSGEYIDLLENSNLVASDMVEEINFVVKRDSIEKRDLVENSAVENDSAKIVENYVVENCV